MAERTVKTVTRTLTVSDLTPAEMASVFADWSDIDQAEFFHHLRAESRDWPNSGWCGQAYNIVSRLSPDGRAIVEALADHVRS